jgi:protein-serine/threonine kinase
MKKTEKELMKYKKNRLQIENYKILDDISQGKFSSVHLVQHKTNKRIFAMKIIKKNDMIVQDCIHRISSELKIISNLNKFYFPKFIGTAQNRKKFYIIMEYFPGGDFYYWEKRITDVSDKTCQFYMGQILLMIEYLHNNNILYRDFKPENIILHIDGYLRLIDFGSAVELPMKFAKTFSVTGTPEFMAPEMLLKKGHTIAVDFWAFGILIYEFITKQHPFYDSDPMESYTRIIKAQYTFPKNFPPFAKSLIKKLLVNDPKKRLGVLDKGIEKIRNHPFFSQTNWEDLENKKITPPFTPQLTSLTDTKYFSKYKILNDDLDEIDPKNDPFILW